MGELSSINGDVRREKRDEGRPVFLMIGLPKMGRPWEPYRAAQKKVCEETGGIYVDTFGAGLGDMHDVHPRDKAAFADLAIKALVRQQAYNNKAGGE